MSLIERAVGRLTGGEDAPPSPPPADQQAGGQPPKPSTIEAFVERAAQQAGGDVPPPAVALHPASYNAPGSLRPAVHVALEPMRSRGFVMPDGEQSRIAQEFRVIKRPLIANAFGKGATPVKNGKRVMVTSAFPGEGKSFVAINLALSIAAGLIKAIVVMVATPFVAPFIGLNNPRAAVIFGGLMGTSSGVADGLAATDPKLVPYGCLTAAFYTALGCLLGPSLIYFVMRAVF